MQTKFADELSAEKAVGEKKITALKSEYDELIKQREDDSQSASQQSHIELKVSK